MLSSPSLPLPLLVDVSDSSNQPNNGFTTPGFSRTQYSNSCTHRKRMHTHKEVVSYMDTLKSQWV